MTFHETSYFRNSIGSSGPYKWRKINGSVGLSTYFWGAPSLHLLDPGSPPCTTTTIWRIIPGLVRIMARKSPNWPNWGDSPSKWFIPLTTYKSWFMPWPHHKPRYSLEVQTPFTIGSWKRTTPYFSRGLSTSTRKFTISGQWWQGLPRISTNVFVH